MEVLIVISLIVIVCCTFLIGSYIVGACADEPQVNRKKMWLVVFLFGPGAWLGGALTALAYYAIDNSASVANWFRRK